MLFGAFSAAARMRSTAACGCPRRRSRRASRIWQAHRVWKPRRRRRQKPLGSRIVVEAQESDANVVIAPVAVLAVSSAPRFAYFSASSHRPAVDSPKLRSLRPAV